MDIVLLNLSIFLLLILLLFLYSMVWPPDSPWSPWWRTSKKIAVVMCKLAKIKKSDVIYDLGCGDGVALVTAAKDYGAKGVGVEIDVFRVLIARLRVFLTHVSGSVTIDQKNFFDVDVSSSTVVFMYLIPKTLKRLKPKLLNELKPGSRVVTFVYRLDYLPLIASDLKNEVYVYEIPKKKK